MNEKDKKRRLKAGEKMLAQYEPGTEGYDTAITDALTDLRHMCDAKGLDFAKLDKMAYRHYLNEVHG